jgi:hypothetical protein
VRDLIALWRRADDRSDRRFSAFLREAPNTPGATRAAALWRESRRVVDHLDRIRPLAEGAPS